MVHTRSCLFQHKLLDFVALRTTGFVFLLLLSSLLQKHKTCRPQSNKIMQFVLEKTRTSVERRQGPGRATAAYLAAGQDAEVIYLVPLSPTQSSPPL